MNEILFYLGSVLPVVWGVAHLFPTQSVVRDFGEISLDNRRIITMEWIVEGVALIFIGVLVAVVTVMDYQHPVSMVVYLLSAVTLIVLAIISLFTGFKVNFFPYKLCPFLFATAAMLILAGVFL